MLTALGGGDGGAARSTSSGIAPYHVLSSFGTLQSSMTFMLVLMPLARRPSRTPRRGAGCSGSHGLLVGPELLLSYCSCGGASAAIRRQSPATRRRRTA